MKRTIVIIFSLLLAVILSGCLTLTSILDTYTNNERSHSDTDISDDPKPESDPDPDPDSNALQIADTPVWGLFPFSFDIEDIYGNLVTTESMGEKQLFFVHLWATWCSPCIAELPDLAVVAGEYADRVGFIGLLDDFDSNPDGAKNLIDSSNKPESFITVDARLPELEDLLDLLKTGYVPTTVIFTADGTMFEPLIGAYGYGYAAVLDAILEGSTD
jgi:thiol-disulfide isomerase/thioredoxin